MIKIIGIGDNVCDMYVDSNDMYPGGQALNVAVYATKLGAGSAYMGVFGSDEVARHVVQTLDDVGVDRSRCRHIDGENGYALIRLVNGDRTFLASNRGGVAKQHPIVLDAADKAYLRQFDLVHTSNNSYFQDQLPIVHELGVPISYDFSKGWEDWTRTAEICPYLTYGFLSCSEMSQEEVLAACRRIRELGCQVAIATMGSDGTWLYDGERTLFQEAQTVEAVDTLGAGDSFAAAFLVHAATLLRQGAEREPVKREDVYRKALLQASSFAANSCLNRGAFGYGIQIPESVKPYVVKALPVAKEKENG